MRSLTRSLTFAVALAALSVAAAPALAHAGKRPRCTAAGHHLIRATANVVVYDRPANRRDNIGEPERGVYACARPNGRSYLLGYDDVAGREDGEYGPDSALVSVKIADRFVVAQFVTGLDVEAMCSKYSGSGAPPCPPPARTLRVVATASGRSTSIPFRTDAYGVAPVAISPAGALAWVDGPLYATRLKAAGAYALTNVPTLLDPGPIDPRSLAASGLTVSWVSAGAPHSATVS